MCVFTESAIYRTDIVNLNARVNAASTAAGGLLVGVTLAGYNPTDILRLSLPDGLTWIAWSPWGVPSPPNFPGHSGSVHAFNVIRGGVASDDTGMGEDNWFTAPFIGLYDGFEAARAAFPGTGRNEITGAASYTFYILDNPINDNSGGLSVLVEACLCLEDAGTVAGAQDTGIGPDIRTIWNVPNGRGDYRQAGAALESGDDLETQILISLFTDRLARSDDVIPDGTRDPRGWWGDLDQAVRIGSRLWLLDRAKLIEATAKRARDYAAEALQWLIDDGVVARFDLITEIRLPNRLGLEVIAYRTDSQGRTVASNYQFVWQGLS